MLSWLKDRILYGASSPERRVSYQDIESIVETFDKCSVQLNVREYVSAGLFGHSYTRKEPTKLYDCGRDAIEHVKNSLRISDSKTHIIDLKTRGSSSELQTIGQIILEYHTGYSNELGQFASDYLVKISRRIEI